LLLVAFAAGAWMAGVLSSAQDAGVRSQIEDEVNGTRPPALQRAWRAFERDQFDKLDEAFQWLRESPPSEPAFVAEAELLGLLRAGKRDALLAFANRNQQWPAGASALEHLIATSREDAERADLLELLRTRYPRTWRGEARTK
jgi:hypothetical protein